MIYKYQIAEKFWTEERIMWLFLYKIGQKPTAEEKEKLRKAAKEEISFTGQAETIWKRLRKVKGWTKPKSLKNVKCAKRGTIRSGKRKSLSP